MIVYKLTTQDNKTRKGERNECTWGPGVTHSGTGEGDLCGPGYIHAYTSPLLAVLLNPIHADIKNPRLWECSVSSIAKSDKGLKVGSVSLTTDREISLPEVSTRQRVIFAILCAEKALSLVEFPSKEFTRQIRKFSSWASLYKTGIPAARAAYAAAYAAARTASYDAAAAYAAAYAADAAAYAASYDAAAADLPLVELAEEALTYS